MRQISSAISLTCAKVYMYFNEVKLASGSAFFYKYNAKTFLITNRHNVTGRHQDSGKALSRTGGLPNRLQFHSPLVEVSSSKAILGDRTRVLEIKLDDEIKLHSEHPTRPVETDIVAFDCDKLWPARGGHQFHVNDLREEQPIHLMPAMNVSVVGFPYGKEVYSTPIWVNGTIASEPEFDVDGRPTMYIDCRTNRGSSGSPVFVTSIGNSMPMKEQPRNQMGIAQYTYGNSIPLWAFSVPVHKFIGIYSGRIDQDSDIGLVWKKEAIEAVCGAG